MASLRRPLRSAAPLVAFALAAALTVPACRRSGQASAADAPFERPANVVVAEPIYDSGRKPTWNDWGWSKHADVPNGPARIELSGWGGWILARPNLTGIWGALVFRYKPPAGFGESLAVHLVSPDRGDLPHVTVRAPWAKAEADGWFDVYIPMSRLNPGMVDVDRIIFSTTRNVPAGWVEFDRIGLTAPAPGAARPAVVVQNQEARLEVQCSGTATPIQPMIYGIAFSSMNDAKSPHQWQLGATARRWGGNPASRYNWQLGNAWNTGSDWYFENVNHTSNPGFTYDLFLQDNRQQGVRTALTVPILGWVAKDISSAGFPRSAHPDQQSFDQWRPEAGNGKTAAGALIPSGPATRTSVPAPPEFIKKWVEAIVAKDKQLGTRTVHQYILDNEPALWSSTHRDVHPEALTYNELLDRTIQYGTAIRQADPDAVIAGPAEWGWPNYFYSAKDMAAGHLLRPDRRAHGDVPLIPYYLTKLKDHEAKTGTRILDVLDLHFYPQAKNVYSSQSDPDTAALRLRQTRGLWDPSYRDESWIADTVKLLPRMKEWIDQNYPGRGISIGEWNFGGEQHVSGALAIAEALGLFGQHGVTSAFYWTFPPANSPAYWAFRMFRNFDGKGAAFEQMSVPTRRAPEASLYASRDASGKRWVLLAINTSVNLKLKTRIELTGCAAATKVRSFTYAGESTGPVAGNATSAAGYLSAELAPSSLTVIEFETATP